MMGIILCGVAQTCDGAASSRIFSHALPDFWWVITPHRRHIVNRKWRIFVLAQIPQRKPMSKKVLAIK
jgi:hypothetical protein